MTSLPYAIQGSVLVNFPAKTMGQGPVTVGKANGIWTVSLNLVGLAPLQAGYDPTTKYILIFDILTQTWVQGPIATIFGGQLPTIVTAAGPYNVVPGDYAILMNKTVGAASTINLPVAASRVGVPLIIKDFKGDAVTNQITVVANGVETIDGMSNAAAQAAGVSKLTFNYQSKIFRPLAAGGWYVTS